MNRMLKICIYKREKFGKSHFRTSFNQTENFVFFGTDSEMNRKANDAVNLTYFQAHSPVNFGQIWSKVGQKSIKNRSKIGQQSLLEDQSLIFFYFESNFFFWNFWKNCSRLWFLKNLSISTKNVFTGKKVEFEKN